MQFAREAAILNAAATAIASIDAVVFGGQNLTREEMVRALEAATAMLRGATAQSAIGGLAMPIGWGGYVGPVDLPKPRNPPIYPKPCTGGTPGPPMPDAP